MDTSDSKRGKQVYIQGHLLPQVERYARDNNLPFAKAINEIVSDHFRKPLTDDSQPATRQDLKKIHKKIELTNMLLEPALLELLEASSHSRYETNSDPDKAQLGLAIKRKYSELFRDLRDML